MPKVYDDEEVPRSDNGSIIIPEGHDYTEDNAVNRALDKSADETHRSAREQNRDWANNVRKSEQGHAEKPNTSPIDKKKVASRNDIKKAEKAGDDNQVGLGHNKDDDYQSRGGRLKDKLWGSKKKKGMTIGSLIGGSAFGGGFLIMTIVSGPGQFIQFSQMLSGLHFSHLSSQSDSRFSDMLRDFQRFKALRTGEGYERTRMGMLANRSADKYVAKLRESGITMEYEKGTGKFVRYKFDVENHPSLKAIVDKFGGVKDASGKYYVIGEDAGVKSGLRGRRLFNAVGKEGLGEAGVGKLGQQISIRKIRTRANISFHELTDKLKGMKLKKMSELLQKKQVKEIENGAESPEVVEAEKIAAEACQEAASAACKEAQDRVKNAKAAAQEANQLYEDGNRADTERAAGNSELVEKFKGQIREQLKGASIAAVVGLLCALNHLNHNWPEIQEARVILPLIRQANMFISIGSQIQSNKDFDMKQLGYFSKQLYDDTKKSETNNDPYAQTGWQDSQAQKAEEISSGMSVSSDEYKHSVAPDETLKGSGKSESPLKFFDLPGIKQVVNTACNQIVQGGLQIAGFAFGGAGLVEKLVSAGIGVVVGQFLNKGIEAVVNLFSNWLMGAPVDPLAKGAGLGNAAHFGARFEANTQAIASGGSPLSQKAVAQLDKDEYQQTQEKFASESFASRLFNPYEANSLLSRFIRTQNPNIASNVVGLGSRLSGVLGSLTSSLANIIFPPAHAAGSVNLEKFYGFPEYGFSDNEVDAVGSPYKNAQSAAQLLDSNGENGVPDYIGRAKTCFGVDINNGADGWDATTNSDFVNPYGGKLPAYCKSKSKNWRTIRFFIFDTGTMKAMSCYEGEEGACSEFGFGSSSESDDSADSSTPSGGSLPKGSAKELASKLLPYIKKGAITCVGGQGASCPDIQKTASGTSIKGGACHVDSLDPSLVGMLLKLVQDGHTFKISAICSDHPSNPKSAHHQGKAVDFNTIDDVFMGPSATAHWTNEKLTAAKNLDKEIASFMPKSTGFGQVQCHPKFSFLDGFNTFKDGCHHQHVQVE